MKKVFRFILDIIITTIIIGIIPILVMFSEITFEDAIACFVGVFSIIIIFLLIILGFLFINNKLSK